MSVVVAIKANGKIYIGDSGEIFKAFNIKDGCGIHDLAIPHGIMPIIRKSGSEGGELKHTSFCDF